MLHRYLPVASSSFKAVDKGWDAFVEMLPELKSVSIKTGIQADAGVGDDGVSIAEYAAFNEFGTSNIPERSFIRATADNERRKWSAALDKMITEVIKGNRSLDNGLGIVGQLTEQDIKRTIRNLSEPANAQSTIDTKGSSNPLIDTGIMLNSIRYIVEHN